MQATCHLKTWLALLVSRLLTNLLVMWWTLQTQSQRHQSPPMTHCHHDLERGELLTLVYKVVFKQPLSIITGGQSWAQAEATGNQGEITCGWTCKSCQTTSCSDGDWRLKVGGRSWGGRSSAALSPKWAKGYRWCEPWQRIWGVGWGGLLRGGGWGWIWTWKRSKHIPRNFWSMLTINPGKRKG